jgi:hypothetical protein
VLLDYFNLWGVTFNIGPALWRLAGSYLNPAGHGLSNQYITPQGGAGSIGTYPSGYMQANQSPGLQVLLDWNTATAVAHVGYTLTGPSVGTVGNALVYTLTPGGTTTDVITFSDGGAGGSFAPSTLTITNSSSAQTFSYTPAVTGTTTLTVTSTQGGVVTGSPLSISSSHVNYVLRGPSAGTVGLASAYALVPSGTTTDTITFSDGGNGGTFYPATLVITGSYVPQSFSYVPSSIGMKALTLTSKDGGTITGSPSSLSVSAPRKKHTKKWFPGLGRY